MGRKKQKKVKADISTSNAISSGVVLLTPKKVRDEQLEHINEKDTVSLSSRQGASFASNFLCPNPKDLRIMETPQTNKKSKPLLDEVFGGFSEISHLIIWENNHSYSRDDELSSSEESKIEQQSENEIQSQEMEKFEHESEKSNDKIVDIGMTKQKLTIIEEKKTFLTFKQPLDKPPPKKFSCNCKKTKCLKLYCDCFRENLTCGEWCNCIGCHNTSEYEEERNNVMLSLKERDPDAFKSRIEENHHSKGCKCKKSNCLKKYCECFGAGIKCGEHCKCEGCKNMGDEGEENGQKFTAKKQKRFIEL